MLEGVAPLFTADVAAMGELSSRFEFSYDGLHAEVDVVTLCCRSEPTLAAQEISVTTHQACVVTMTAGIDPVRIPGRWLERCVDSGDERQGSRWCAAVGDARRLGI